MNILTIDTSDRSIVGMVSHESEFVELACQIAADARHHAETLTPMVSRVIEGIGGRPDAIVVGTGPAAFTGLRAGLMTARSLARGWDVPVYGVSSLDVLALGGADLGATEIVSIIDARRKELFALRAKALGRDDVVALDSVQIIKPAAIAEIAGATFVTPNPGLYPQLESAEQVVCSPILMARLAMARLARSKAGEQVDLGTEPQYLRRPDIHRG